MSDAPVHSVLPTSNPTAPALDLLVDRVRSGALTKDNGTGPGDVHVSVSFLTVQGAQHPGRRTGYVNTVLSTRVGGAVGSCAVEPGTLGEQHVQETVGRTVDELLTHPEQAVRVAALDAYLAHVAPHPLHPRAKPVAIPAGTSLEKSLARARAVAELAQVPPGGRVAVIGVVNSLLSALRERDIPYIPCDLKGGRTEWDEPVLPDHGEAISQADAVLASGMVLGNDTFDDITALCRERDLPLTMFAQTGSAALRELVGSEISALSAEPYPFFWLTGDSNHLYSYVDDRRPW